MEPTDMDSIDKLHVATMLSVLMMFELMLLIFALVVLNAFIAGLLLVAVNYGIVSFVVGRVEIDSRNETDNSGTG